MPKRRPSRRERRGRAPTTRPFTNPVPAPVPVGEPGSLEPIAPAEAAPAPVRAVAPVMPVAAPKAERERSVTRFTARDYTYVRRELQRIAILAIAIIIAIVVLSFFLP